MAERETAGPVVSVSWLAANIGRTDIVVLESYMKPLSAPGKEEQEQATVQIPGTRIFDFETRICDRESGLPHMMPPPALFEQEVRALGVNHDSLVVAYDRKGIFSSPRAWWMFKAMGHDRVVVLDGGLPAWVAAGLPTEQVRAAMSGQGDFVARPVAGLFSDIERVARALHDEQFAVLDARGEGRFCGREPEPREGVRGGHMPGAFNLPYASLLEGGHLKNAAEIREIFAATVSPDRHLIFTCGSGVTACILALAATTAGYAGFTVYDGSWSEWGGNSGRPSESCQ